MLPRLGISLVRRDRRSRIRLYTGAVLVAVAVLASLWLAASDVQSQRRLEREVDRALQADAVLFCDRLEQITATILYDEYVRPVLAAGAAQVRPVEFPQESSGVIQFVFVYDVEDSTIHAPDTASPDVLESIHGWLAEQSDLPESWEDQTQLRLREESLHVVGRRIGGTRRNPTRVGGVAIDQVAVRDKIIPAAYRVLEQDFPPESDQRNLLSQAFGISVQTPDDPIVLTSLGDDITFSAVGTHVQAFVLGGLFPDWEVRVDYLNEARESAQRRILASLIPLLIVILGLFYVSSVAVHEMEVGSMKSAFVSNASHELKTPLTKIQFFNEILQSLPESASEKRQHYHDVIARESRRLKMLVDNVLDMGRIEEGRQRYAFQMIQIDELVQEVVDTVAVMYEEDGYEIALDIAGELPDVNVDPQAMKQVLFNLLDNAIKYSQPHVIRVEVERARLDAGSAVAVKVADRGRGIPRGQLNRIFEEFYRVPESTSKPSSGTGLGLALVRQIIRAHSGDVHVDSRVGEGSTFTILLPSAAKNERETG